MVAPVSFFSAVPKVIHTLVKIFFFVTVLSLQFHDEMRLGPLLCNRPHLIIMMKDVCQSSHSLSTYWVVWEQD